MIFIDGNHEVYDFGMRLKKLRKDQNLTQRQVARRLDVHENTISGYENNTQFPPIDKLKTLAIIYRSSADYILGLTDESPVTINDLPASKQKLIQNIIDCIRREYLDNINNSKDL